MNYSVDWLIPQRVISFHFWDALSVQDSHTINALFGKMIEEGQAPVHIIAEVGEKGSIPTDISLLSKKSVLTSEKFGYLIVIGASPIVSFIAKMVTGLLKVKVEMLGSVDEAMMKLQTVDSSLKND